MIALVTLPRILCVCVYNLDFLSILIITWIFYVGDILSGTFSLTYQLLVTLYGVVVDNIECSRYFTYSRNVSIRLLTSGGC